MTYNKPYQSYTDPSCSKLDMQMSRFHDSSLVVLTRHIRYYTCSTGLQPYRMGVSNSLCK